ncbi:MAG TPA: recombinase family protein [Candidatus Thermoplasmatota archaeon]|nr:recombinase family protein [Candidatus Thermoplasmatota archaeon]
MEVESRGQTLRAATYARVSSPKQKTVVEQTRICRERAEERGWKVAYVLQDQGLQGDDLERPAFQRLMDLAERHAIDVVVCWKIDRLARSLAHAVTLEETLSRHGVAIHSCTEPIDTTSPVGRFLFGNLANAAQLEKAIIRERVRMGVHSQALQGRWLQPQVPLGYRRTKGLYLRVVPEEATTVRAVFEVYQVHQSYAEAAAALCAAGLTNRGKPWTGERVRQTLENEIYRGKYVASGVVKMVPHLAIVTPETFEAVRSLRLAAPRRGRLSSPSLRERAIDQVFAQYLDGLRDLG